MNRLLTTVVCITLALGALSLQAAVPGTITYQGRLTDGAGDPVPDGAYLIQFRIYDAAVAGTELWNSAFREIQVADGLFSYNLGDTVALPTDLFASDTIRYLGVKVSTDPEMTPRIRLITVPYAYHAATADSLTGDIYVNEAGDTLSGGLLFWDGLDSVISVNPDSRKITLHGADGFADVRLESPDFGIIRLYDAGNQQTVYLTGQLNSGGQLVLYDNNGIKRVDLFAGEAGDLSIELPTDAINSDEILDGTIQAIDLSASAMASAGSVLLSEPTGGVSSTDPTTLDSFMVSVSASGVVLVTVTGRYYFNLDATSSSAVSSYGALGVCRTRNSSANCGGTYQSVYYQDADNASNDNHTPFFSLQLLDVVTAGTHWYYLNGEATLLGVGDLRLWGSSTATAIYFPGSLDVSSGAGSLPATPATQE